MTHKFGYVMLAGRPNMGKSTLINKIVGEKIAIISSKPQTTRHRILGIVSDEEAQMVFVDTPGIHDNHQAYANRLFNRAALSTIDGVDLILFMVSAQGWTEADEVPFRAIKQSGVPFMVVVNRMDTLKDKSSVLPLLQKISQKVGEDVPIIPISALKGHQVPYLLEQVRERLPEGESGFPEDYLTDKNDRFQCAEFVREQLFEQLGSELPYATAVEVEDYGEDDERVEAKVVVWVSRSGQKAIVIGKKGERLKQIGIRARKSLEDWTGKKVRLDIWVKVKSGWQDDKRNLHALGYTDQ